MSIDDERSQILNVIGHLSDRVKDLQGAFESRPAPLLTEEEHEWVKAAIKREAQDYEFRKAVIGKTLAGLLWAAVAAIGTLAWSMLTEYATRHGWKP